MEYFATIAAERRALADTLAGLSPAQWETGSLCGAWTVRDVTAHLILAATGSLRQFLPVLIAAGGNFHRASRTVVARESVRPTADLVAGLRQHADSRFTPPTLGPAAPLAEVLLHGQDIRVPLRIDDGRPAGSWPGALDFLVSPKARRGFVPRRLPRLRYAASDVDWSRGEGEEEVRGPAAALALTMAGRTARLDDLDGPGVAALRAWAAG